VNDILFVMGVCGCGKTTVGKALAQRLELPYLEGDLFHPEENILKMASGQALNDADRWPWLETINETIGKHRETGCVVACSALKKRYREVLAATLPKDKVYWFYLEGSQELISQRLGERKDHFMPQSLLESQFDALELSPELMPVSIDRAATAIVDEIVSKI